MSGAAIHTFEDIHRRDREKAHQAYISAPEFKAMEAKAKAKGFRHATLAEIHESAENACGVSGGIELFTYRGGLWVRLEASHG